MECIESGNVGATRILLDGGMSVNERNCEDATALHIAIMQKREATVQLLLERNANTNVRDCHGMMPIEYAVSNEFEAGLRLLLAHGGPAML